MTALDLTIIDATPDHEEAIRTLWDRVIQDAFKRQGMDEHHNPADELDFKMDQLTEAWHHPSQRYFLAYENAKLIGTMAYGKPPNRGIRRRTGGALNNTVEIGSLYIHPDYQRQGIGKTLLIHALKTLHSEGVDTVCFDSIIESSKTIWLKLFGEPRYKIPSKKHDFTHMIWVVDTKTALKRLMDKENNKNA
ncbi:MAG: N-acetyltransferase family protein [Candidatus Izemoplasmataceae bacterium]